MFPMSLLLAPLRVPLLGLFLYVCMYVIVIRVLWCEYNMYDVCKWQIDMVGNGGPHNGCWKSY
jgi:hypothetical protein